MTPPMTARKTSSVAASVTRRPASNRLATPRRSSHSVRRLPPPWTTTTGRRRRSSTISRSTPCSLDDGRAAELDDEGLARPGDLIRPSAARSRRVGRVLDHVGLGQVAAKGLARPGALRRGRGGCAPRRRACARAAPGPSKGSGSPAKTGTPSIVDAQAIRVEGHGLTGPRTRAPPRPSRPAASRTAAQGRCGVAGRARDAPPVGVGAVDGRLDEVAGTTARATARASASSRAPLDLAA